MRHLGFRRSVSLVWRLLSWLLLSGAFGSSLALFLLSLFPTPVTSYCSSDPVPSLTAGAGVVIALGAFVRKLTTTSVSRYWFPHVSLWLCLVYSSVVAIAFSYCSTYFLKVVTVSVIATLIELVVEIMPARRENTAMADDDRSGPLLILFARDISLVHELC